MKQFVKQSKLTFLLVAMFMVATTGYAQSHSNRISLGVGALYERGLDAILAWEHETKNHNAWEYFVNGYLKYEDDPIAGHITNDSFWKSYNTWGAGVAYKPCIVRGGIRHGRNHYGALRLGGSVGSDCHEAVGWVNVGYEHNYALKNGWYLYWQLKTDLCINGKDLFRTGVTIGVKLPYNAR